MKWCDHRLENSKRPLGLAGFVAVLFGSHLVMELAAGIAGSASGEHVSTTHHPRLHSKILRLTPLSVTRMGPFSRPETGKSQSNWTSVQDQMGALLGQKRLLT